MVKYQRCSYHPSTAGDLLLLNKYSVRLCYSSRPPETAVKPFFLQACEGDTPGPEGQRGRESTDGPWLGVRETEGQRRTLTGSCLCGCAPRQQSNPVNRLSTLNLGATPREDAGRRFSEEFTRSLTAEAILTSCFSGRKIGLKQSC